MPEVTSGNGPHPWNWDNVAAKLSGRAQRGSCWHPWLTGPNVLEGQIIRLGSSNSALRTFTLRRNPLSTPFESGFPEWREPNASGAGFLRIRGLVEKPEAADAPSNLAVIGRYVLHPRVFDVLAETGPGRGGEIQLTDALQALALADGPGAGVYGVVFRGRRFDTGDKLSYLKAAFTLALEREDVGPGLREWLAGMMAPLP
jgi:hypothetical protein